MIEGRAIISNIEETKKRVESLSGSFKSSYAFKDIIFVPKKKNYNLSDDLLRVRVISKNNWPTKNVILVRKQTEFKNLGKIDKVILKKEFDAENEALDFIKKGLSAEFEYGFEYSREGWEYQLENHRVFIENIENLKPSIEIEADSEEDLQRLFDKIGIVKKLRQSIPEAVRESLSGIKG